MPELPEVETIVRTLRPAAEKRRVDAVHVLRRDIIQPADFDLASAILGRTIIRLHRRGKKIVFDLDDGNRFFIHLGMTGRLTLRSPNAPRAPHTHLILQISQPPSKAASTTASAGANPELHFSDPRRFGGIFWLGTDGSPDTDLGPEPFALQSSQLALLLSRTSRSIKTALLDQKLIAGIGNIYADEALFTAGIDPRVASKKLSQPQIIRLNRAIKSVLNRAIKNRGSTLRDYRDATGQPGNFQKIHRVYDREGDPCLICGSPILRIVLGGRSTHYCSNCQSKTAKPAIIRPRVLSRRAPSRRATQQIAK